MTTALTVADKEKQQAFDALTAPAKTALESIRERVSKAKYANVMSCWDIGNIIETVTKDTTKYGDRTVESFGLILDLCETGNAKREAAYLYELRGITRAFPERKVLEEFVKTYPRASKKMVTFVAQMPTEAKRTKLLAMIVRDGMTANQVAEYVKSKLGQQADPSPASSPRTAVAVAQDITNTADSLLTRLNRWDTLFEKLSDAADDEFTPRLRAGLVEAQTKLSQVTEALAGRSKKLSQLAEAADKALAKKPEASTQGTAEKTRKTTAAKNGKAKKTSGKKKRSANRQRPVPA